MHRENTNQAEIKTHVTSDVWTNATLHFLCTYLVYNHVHITLMLYEINRVVHRLRPACVVSWTGWHLAGLTHCTAVSGRGTRTATLVPTWTNVNPSGSHPGCTPLSGKMNVVEWPLWSLNIGRVLFFLHNISCVQCSLMGKYDTDSKWMYYRGEIEDNAVTKSVMTIEETCKKRLVLTGHKVCAVIQWSLTYPLTIPVFFRHAYGRGHWPCNGAVWPQQLNVVKACVIGVYLFLL